MKDAVALTNLCFESREQLDLELDLLQGRAQDEAGQECCDAYLYMRPLRGDGTVLTLLEVYDSYENMRKVAEAQANPDVGKPAELTRYLPRGGYLQRPTPSSTPLKDQFIWVARMKAHPGQRSALIDAILEHAKFVEENEEEALSFLALESVEDGVSVVVFERYTNEEYLRNVHATSDSMARLRDKLRVLVDEKSSTGYAAVSGFVDKQEALV